MKVIRSVSALREALSGSKKTVKSIGFVPTMGALHRGHLELVKKSIAENELSICSIFVNPTQFNDLGDLQEYPRTLDEDLKLLKEAGCNIAFVPEVKEVYPDQRSLQVKKEPDFGPLTQVLEAANRPGHFAGVLQIVGWFFEQISPQKAYFGEKDYQQLAVVRKWVKSNAIPVEIRGVHTVREESGLAASSRNKRLSESGKLMAASIYCVMQQCLDGYSNFLPEKLKAWGVERLTHSGLKVEYFDVVDADSLETISSWKDAENVRIVVAAWVDGVRLLDNLALNPKKH